MWEVLPCQYLGFARDALELTGTHSVLGIPAARLYADFNESGRGKLDMSAVVLALRELSKEND